jgi:hypothetical protein
MENQRPDYYINRKRKIIDFLIGILVSVPAYILVFFLIESVYFIMAGGNSGYGISGLLFAPFLIAIVSGFWLFLKPKRKFILIGVISLILVPMCIIGTCILSF